MVRKPNDRFHYYSWTDEDDLELARIILSGKRKRIKVKDLLVEASVKLKRTVLSCHNRWYEIRGKFTEVP